MLRFAFKKGLESSVKLNIDLIKCATKLSFLDGLRQQHLRPSFRSREHRRSATRFGQLGWYTFFKTSEAKQILVKAFIKSSQGKCSLNIGNWNFTSLALFAFLWFWTSNRYVPHFSEYGFLMAINLALDDILLWSFFPVLEIFKHNSNSISIYSIAPFCQENTAQ